MWYRDVGEGGLVLHHDLHLHLNKKSKVSQVALTSTWDRDERFMNGDESRRIVERKKEVFFEGGGMWRMWYLIFSLLTKSS